MAASPPTSPSGASPPAEESWRKEYWRRNVRLMVILLAIWFFVSFVLGILLAEPLNDIVIGGFGVGFWFAQQGSIITFVVLILVYAVRMDHIDEEFGVDERDETGARL